MSEAAAELQTAELAMEILMPAEMTETLKFFGHRFGSNIQRLDFYKEVTLKMAANAKLPKTTFFLMTSRGR